ncbi:MAG TPA: isoaspartyl peptidase/L-asparaginase [Flavisolibacter sp.]|jgi:beta-aspartyl-peptidase (threonine type)|nr:isoaspartyl peptidase/L-asparaginase [Flavisolibacter sp.]
MNKIAIAIHGGAGPDSDYIKQNSKEYKKGLEEAINEAYEILKQGASAVDAVETAIKTLEDNPLFNAGKGSALTDKAEVEMCASIMNGFDLKCGAAAIVKNVRNPIRLARSIMEKSKHIYIGSIGAAEFAKELNLPMELDAYFITEYQFEKYESTRKKINDNGQELAIEQLNKKHGTVGAVALDIRGDLAAGTSTGGTDFCRQGRIADSSMIGAGTYANNETCAVSTTGEGELHIQHVSAFHISALMEYKGMSLREACRYLIHEKCKHINGDMGLIAVDTKGNLVAEFNAQRMHRAMKSNTQDLIVEIYPK